MLLRPNQLPISWKLKTALGCISKKPVRNQDEIVKIKGIPLCHHDLYHLEISQLKRIQIGKHLVSGIHGINTPVLHDEPIVEEYDGILDEVRVAFHEFLVNTSVYNTVKVLAWAGWLVFNRMNPIAIMWRHHTSLKCGSNNETT